MLRRSARASARRDNRQGRQQRVVSFGRHEERHQLDTDMCC